MTTALAPPTADATLAFDPATGKLYWLAAGIGKKPAGGP